uniref:ATP synthase complex subunit 8 n=1 Tax=Hyalella neveulemairei TaxID=2759783 RepID=A0A7T8V772_9CRUS|nr:ATP synthase F0 subunit 8 [Hyalella neveulemairei]
MPQMAPMLWSVLFMYFVLLVAILMKLMFFESFCTVEESARKTKVIKLDWKW